MRYIKPQILTSLHASNCVKGTPPDQGKGHTPTIDMENSLQFTPVAAYESDE